MVGAHQPRHHHLAVEVHDLVALLRLKERGAAGDPPAVNAEIDFLRCCRFQLYDRSTLEDRAQAFSASVVGGDSLWLDLRSRLRPPNA